MTPGANRLRRFHWWWHEKVWVHIDNTQQHIQPSTHLSQSSSEELLPTSHIPVPSIGNDGPCSCCSASATARVDPDIQAAQRPSTVISTLPGEQLLELAQFEATAVDMLAMQTPEPSTPLLHRPRLDHHQIILQ